MKLPCELIVWYLLPSIRVEVAKELARLGLSQSEIAKRLGITQPAVCQYLKDKRGKGVRLSRAELSRARELAERIRDGAEGPEVLSGMCAICAMAKADSALCGIHRELEQVPEGCRACAAGVGKGGVC